MDTLNIHPSIKVFSVASAALVATCLCFYLMFLLIANEMTASIEVETKPSINPDLREHEPEKPVATRQRPQKVMPIEPPPDPNAIPTNRTSWVEMEAEKPTFGSIADLLGPSDIQLQLEAPHSDLMPMYVVQPVYPLSAAMREIEGFVIVEFSVRENGTVVNPMVVQSEPKVVFDEAALHAVTRFKFKPREVGGETVSVEKVQLKFSFNLDSLYEIPEEYQR
ncbi:MAG: TonB family protein [Gammaproteobacteria bacterium]|jgi:periplasmic protein TonB|nr:TonB family protein [Gammaproteobacteria bacterium]MBT4493212.1 TonB family protein [Gammaproteobacteria bacterium]MBT7371364.1 TonB family protein [Gammaproteobacteria bacterium]